MSPGLQEFVGCQYPQLATSIDPVFASAQVEAATFLHFLASSYILITLDDLRTQMPLHLTVDDYLLGVADLTGEVMRWV